MKKIYIATIILLIVSFFATQAHAVSPKNAREASEKTEAGVPRAASASPTVNASKVEKTKLKASGFIDNRIELLQRLITRIDNDKKLSDADKNTIKTEVNNEIKKLQDLKTKISQDTDDQTIREDFKNVLAERIYLHFVPQIRISVIIENLLSSQKKMVDLSGRLQTLINNLKSEGQDVTTAQKTLDDMNTKLANIKTMLDDDKTKLTTVTAANYKETYVAIRQDLAKIRAQFAQVRADIAKLRKDLKAIKKTVTVTPTVKPTTTP